MLRLVKPTKKYEKSWREAVEEFRKDSKTIKLWEVLGNPDDLDGIIRNARLHSQDKNLPKGWVPYDLLWLVDGDEIVGIASIRHKLNPFLLEAGGHIGYEVKPSKRGCGYANKILQLSLKRFEKLGIEKILVTAFDNNVASWKAIEKNGGKLKNRVKVENEKDTTRRYWIKL